MNKDHMEVLLEQVVSQNNAILEHLDDLPTRADFHRLEDKVDNIDRCLGVVEAAAKDMSLDLEAHKNDTRLHPISNLSGGMSV